MDILLRVGKEVKAVLPSEFIKEVYNDILNIEEQEKESGNTCECIEYEFERWVEYKTKN